MKINEVTYKEIERLTDIGLSRLLLNLLKNEARKCSFSGVREIIVPLKINVADAGDDGRVDCDNTNGSHYVHFNFSLFQNKATDLQPGQVYSEFFSVDTPDAQAVTAGRGRKAKPATTRQLVLKAKIKEVLDAGGQYTFFIGHNYNTSLRDSRLDKAKEALVNYNSLYGTTYLPNQVRIMDANAIASWTNEFIESVSFVQSENGIERPIGLKTLTELEDFPYINEVQFHSNAKLDGYIQQLQQTISQDKGSLRIIGHSGLGKTRLVYEAIKASGILNEAVYFDIVTDAQPIISFTRTYGKTLEGILVVDNCDYYTHKLLKDEITRTGSTFRLITIDYNVSEASDKSKTSQEEYIFLSNRDYLDVVKNILDDQFKGKLDRSHIDQIVDYSEGYPGMAVLFAQVRLKGDDDLSGYLGDEVIERLAFGRDWASKDENKFEVLKACSIFSSFGRPSASGSSVLTSDERDFYAEQRNFIVSQVCDPTKTPRQFMEATDYFEDSRVLERRGHFLSSKPTPLAVKLAMAWWKYADPEKLRTMFPELERLNLAIPLVNRLAELDQVREAKVIVNDLWGPRSPFGSAEVLNTALGSRLFRSVAPVNPDAAISALEIAFGELDIDDLKEKVGPGRRNIVWTLEALAFRKEFFQRAVNMMFRFSAAENENISNNATGQLLQLFHIVLAGTEADLTERLNAIDRHLADEDPRIKHLAILAMMRGLKGESFRRDIGAEKQGSGAPLIDFYPTWPQSAEYWSEILKRLVEIAKNNQEERVNIKDAIARSIRNLFYNNLSFLLKGAIVEISAFDNSYWEEAINQLNAALRYEVVNDEERATVAELINILQPKTLKDQVKYFVSAPVWNFNEAKSVDNYVDHGIEIAENYAKTLIDTKADFSQIWPLVLAEEQRKGYAFGRKLGELLKDENIAYEMLNALEKVPIEQQNALVPAAYISALEKPERIRVINFMINNSALQRYALYVTSLQNPDLNDIEKLFPLLEQGLIQAEQFYQFGYGRGLDGLNKTDVLKVFKKLATYPNAQVIALDLSLKYIGNDSEAWKVFKSFMRTLIISNNLIKERTNSNFQYTWYTTVERIFKEGEDKDLAEVITHQMLELTQEDRISSIDNYLKRTVQYIISSDFDMFWNIMGPAILDNSTYLTLKFFLGSNNGEYGSPGLLTYADPDKLVKWAKKNEPVGPKRLAYMMPVTIQEDATSWHPLAIKMIDAFGDMPGLLEELSANVHSFGSVGSRVPYLKDQMKLFSKMLNHPILRVRNWAQNEVERLKIDIERTKLDDQSEFLFY